MLERLIHKTPHTTTIKVSRCYLDLLHLIQDGKVQHTPSTWMFCPTTQEYKMNIHCKHNFPILAEAFPENAPCTQLSLFVCQNYQTIMIGQMIGKIYEAILEVNSYYKVKDHVGFKFASYMLLGK